MTMRRYATRYVPRELPAAFAPRASAVLSALLLATHPLTAQRMRDSAGIRVVENARPLWTARQQLALAASPTLVIGDTTDSPSRLSGIRGAMRLPDGRIAVLDGGSLQLRFYAPDGRFLSAAAGRGREPGQLTQATLLRRLRGDTIGISSGFSTLSFYTNAGTFIRSSTLPGNPNDPPTARMMLVDLLGNGDRVGTYLPRPSPRVVATRWADSLALQLVPADGGNARSLGTHAYAELQQDSSGPSSTWLSAIGAFAAGDDRFYYGFGDRYAIRVYGSDGGLRSIIRRAWTPVPVTPEEWEQWVVEWSKLWVKDTGTAREREIDKVRRSPYAEVLPAFSAMLVDRTGRLWVRAAHWQDAIGAGSLSDIPAVPSQWSVFDVGGRWLGDVEMPAHFQPYEIGADYVLGKRVRERVGQVVLFPLRAGGR